MRKALLLSILFCVIVLLGAQNSSLLQRKLLKSAFSEQSATSTSVQKHDWSDHTVFFSETFDSIHWHTAQAWGVAVPGNMPQGWSVVDNTNNNFFWRWSTQGPRGAYTSPDELGIEPNETVMLKSTSDQNTTQRGFMMLESDFYNTTQEGEMVDPPVEMDSYIQYGPIDISGAQGVSVYFEQYHRLCCSPFAEGVGLKLYISPDAENWTEIAVHQSAVGATPQNNPSILEMSISSFVAGQSTLYFRFHKLQESHYFWMIDDIYIFEPPAYQTRVENYWIDYSHSHVGEQTDPSFSKLFSITPIFVPYHSFQEIVSSRSGVGNSGFNPLTNVIMTTLIQYHDNSELYSASSVPIESVNPNEVVEMSVVHSYQIPTIVENVGHYQYQGKISADEEIPGPFNKPYVYDFNITKNLYGYVDPLYVSTDRVSPFSFISGGDGDGVGMIVMLNPPLENIEGTSTPAPHELVGANVFIPNDSYNNALWRAGNVANFQVEIYEGILNGNDYTFDVTNSLISSDLMPIDSSFRNKWVFIPFQNSENSNHLSPPAIGTQYLVLIRMFTNEEVFFIGADRKTPSSLYANWICIGDNVGYSISPKNVSMELIVDAYGVDNSSDIRFFFQDYAASENGSPVSNVALEFYTNDNGGVQIVETFYSDNAGLIVVADVRSGTYSYKIEHQGEIIEGSVTAIGRDETVEIAFNLAGIPSSNALNDFTLYPNPTGNRLTIFMNKPAQSVVILDVLGKPIDQFKDVSDRLYLDVKSYKTGVYIVIITNMQGQKSTQTFMKQ